jgi:hypothetical protein
VPKTWRFEAHGWSASVNGGDMGAPKGQIMSKGFRICQEVERLPSSLNTLLSVISIVSGMRIGVLALKLKGWWSQISNLRQGG